MTKNLSLKTGLSVFSILMIALIIFCFPGVANIKDNVSAAGVDPVKETYDIRIAGIQLQELFHVLQLGLRILDVFIDPGQRL